MDKLYDRKTGQDFEHVGTVGSYASYEWEELMIIRDLTTDQLFYVSARGCSCSMIEDSIGDREPITSLPEFTAFARKWGREVCYDRVQLVSQINNLIRKVQRRLASQTPKG